MEMPPHLKEKADSYFFFDNKPSVVTFRSLHKPASKSGNFFYYANSNNLADLATVNYLDNLLCELDKYKEDYLELVDFPRKHFKNVVSGIINKFQDENVSNLVVNPTYDGSVMFSFTANNVNHFFEYFFNHKVDDLDEVIVTAFQGEVMTIDFAGSLEDAYTALFPKKLVYIDNSITNINASHISGYSLTTA